MIWLEGCYCQFNFKHVDHQLFYDFLNQACIDRNLNYDLYLNYSPCEPIGDIAKGIFFSNSPQLKQDILSTITTVENEFRAKYPKKYPVN